MKMEFFEQIKIKFKKIIFEANEPICPNCRSSEIKISDNDCGFSVLCNECGKSLDNEINWKIGEVAKQAIEDYVND
jgi:transposase-like protein